MHVNALIIANELFMTPMCVQFDWKGWGGYQG